VVFSLRLTTTSWPNTHIRRDNLVAAVGRLKGDSEVPLRTMGSLSVVRQLLGTGLVDPLRLMTFPLLVGSQAGSRPWPRWRRPTWSCDHRALDGRVLLVEYRPTGRDIPRA
jgi:dihydrofolate reductase